MGIIAWIDLETTGTDEFDDPIIEAAVIITSDKALTEVARRNWVVVPKRPAEAIARIEAKPPVLEMHTKNGLYQEVLDGLGTPHVQAGEEIATFINSFRSGGGRIPLGGSGVSHFDHRFIAAQWPEVSKLLTYWAYDIGSARRFGLLCGVKAPDAASDSSAKTHRAMDDIEMHVNEARWWMKFLRAMKAEGVLRDLKREAAQE